MPRSGHNPAKAPRTVTRVHGPAYGGGVESTQPRTQVLRQRHLRLARTPTQYDPPLALCTPSTMTHETRHASGYNEKVGRVGRLACPREPQPETDRPYANLAFYQQPASGYASTAAPDHQPRIVLADALHRRRASSKLTP